MRKERPIKNDNRREIYETLCDREGMTLSDLAEELDISHTSVKWHLRKLSDRGLVRERGGGRTRYFPTNRRHTEVDLMLPEIRDSEPRSRILEYLADDPGINQREVAERLSTSRGSARHHLERLDEFGAVERDEKKEGYILTDTGREAYERLNGSGNT